MGMLIYIKQHLSIIWSKIYEKVKQHWRWVLMQYIRISVFIFSVVYKEKGGASIYIGENILRHLQSNHNETSNFLFNL